MKFLEIRLSSQKSLQWIPNLVTTKNISNKKLVNRRCIQVTVKNMKIETDNMVLNFSKRDSTNSYALKTKLFFKNFRKFSGKESMLESFC